MILICEGEDVMSERGKPLCFAPSFITAPEAGGWSRRGTPGGARCWRPVGSGAALPSGGAASGPWRPRAPGAVAQHILDLQILTPLLTYYDRIADLKKGAAVEVCKKL